MNWLKPEIKYVTVEVEAHSKLPELTSELRETFKTLTYNPAFQYLLVRLRLQKAAVQHQLAEGYTLDEREIRYLQAGVYWLNHLEAEVGRLTSVPTKLKTPATPDISDEFARVQASLDLIGQES